MIPTVDPNEISGGFISLSKNVQSAVESRGNATVAFFLECLPERGKRLLDRYLQFQNGGGKGFTSFIGSVISDHADKVCFPRECMLDGPTRVQLEPMIQTAIEKLGRITADEAFGLYFGEGQVYRVGTAISCTGCLMKECPHFRPA